MVDRFIDSVLFSGCFLLPQVSCSERYQIDIKYQMCICSSRRKYLSPFFKLRASYFNVFSSILVFLKKDFTENAMEYLQ